MLNSMSFGLTDSLTAGSPEVCWVSVTSCEMMSMGTGNTMVLLFSEAMLPRVCRYLNYEEKVFVVLSSVYTTCKATGHLTMF